MTLRYTITEEDYLTMVRWALLKKLGTPKTALIKLILKLVIPLGAVAWFVIAYPESPLWLRILLIAAALVFAGIAAFQYFFVDYRARVLMRSAKKTPEAKEYWKEHRLEIAGDKLRLSYGSVTQELPYVQITGLDEFETITLILRGMEVVELVPQSVTQTAEWTEFTRTLFDRSCLEAAEEKDASFEEVLRGASFSGWMDISLDELTAHFVKMKRRSLRYPCGWSAIMAFTILFPLAFGIYSLIDRQWFTFTISLMALILFNLRLLVIFLPSYYDKAKNKLLPPASQGYLIAVCDRTICFGTRSRIVRYSFDSLRKTLRTEDGLYLIFDQQKLLYVSPELTEDLLQALR